MGRPLPTGELAEAARLAGDWSPLMGARIFITGGTGFFGRWVLEVLGEAERASGLGIAVTALSRNPERFLASAQHLREAAWLRFQRGDIRDLAPSEGGFTHFIHGAASSDARDYARHPAAMRHDLVEGARRAAAWVGRQKHLRSALFISSGAVYGPQPPEITHMPEDHPLPPDTEEPSQIYAQGKRDAERVFTAACAASGIPSPIARCFAFAGPHLPLDQHFAFGNFIQDALAGGPIRVGGDGTPMRSYLYASELAAWLWALLMRGRSEAYHVGSDQDVSILSLAEAISAETGATVEVAHAPVAGRPPARYVPEIRKVREHLGQGVTVDLAESIRRTLRWHRSGNAS